MNGRIVPECDVDLAVVMPVLNAEDTIAEQLEALSRQTFAGRWELVLADNGCTDRSVAIARGFGDRMRLRVVDASGVRGAAHARNVGVRATRAPLLAFVDADDVVADDWLHHVADALARYPAVASRFDKERLNPPEVRATRKLAQTEGLGRHNYVDYLPHAGGSGLAVRRAVHDEIDGFDESMLRLEDTDYCWRIQLAGHTLHYEPAALLHVRFRSLGVASVKQAFDYGRFDGHLYSRYRRRGMASVSFLAGLTQVAVVLLHLPKVRDAAIRAKRLRASANLAGILFGRVEARLRRI